MAPLRLRTLRFGQVHGSGCVQNAYISHKIASSVEPGAVAQRLCADLQSPRAREYLRDILRCTVLICACVSASANALAQQWCVYSLSHDAQFRCGYSTEQACLRATKEPHACTIDPFYD